jgi:hypothetical protein
MNIFLHWTALTDCVPAIAAIVRYRNSPVVYRPFFRMLWVGACNAVLSIACAYLFRNNILNSNIYVLAEFIFLLVIFYRWNHSELARKYIILGSAGVLIWILDNLVFHNPGKTINSIYRIYYCMVTIFLSIDFINRLIVFEKKKLIYNAMFLICVGFVCLFSYKAYIESFYLLKLSFSAEFRTNVFFIFQYINAFSNLVFTIAIVCIPKKQEFFMQHS